MIRSNLINIITGYLAHGLPVLANLLFLPGILQLAGMEGYGLISFFSLLLIVSLVFDLGFTPILTREIARSGNRDRYLSSNKEMLRVAERVLLFNAVLIVILMVNFSSEISNKFINYEELNAETVINSLAVMGLAIAGRLFESLYRGVMVGFHKQAYANIIVTLSGCVRWIGGYLVLLFTEANIFEFFKFQVAIATVTCVALYILVHRQFSEETGTQKRKIMARRRMFSMSFPLGIQGVFILLISQIDKLFVSNAFSLEDFGYYSLASLIAIAFVQLAAPVAQTYFATFSELSKDIQKDNLEEEFIACTQAFSSIICTGIIYFIIFTPDILMIWTGNDFLSQRVTPIVRIMLAGAVLNIYTFPLYYVGLASGLFYKFLKMNAFILVLYIFLLSYVASLGSLALISFIYLIINIFYLLIEPVIVFQNISGLKLVRWLRRGIATPLIPLFFLAPACYLMVAYLENEIYKIFILALFISVNLFLSIKKSHEFRQSIIRFKELRQT